MKHLQLPVLDYLRLNNNTIRSPIVVLPSTTLEETVNKMLHEKIHRVFIVESLIVMKPIGVVSQIDIVTLINKITA